jgi:uracil-DNA glycosylase
MSNQFPKLLTTPSSTLSKIKTLSALKKHLIEINLGKLIKINSRVIFGAGDEHAKIMFIGEAPGAKEEAQGLPFVGRAGKLLDTLIDGVNLKRPEVYITNVVKCRPPKNRTPRPNEILKSLPYLQKEIAIIKPKLIITLGRIATQSLLNSSETLSSFRGKLNWYQPQKIAVLATFHPSFLPRFPNKKNEARRDFRKIEKTLSILDTKKP